ncbi:lambda-exonuclease family protein [Saccharopolyspora shandongensis]|uniref:YqaJ viral recombinase family nuclease n=1 Tax=Saccharopolyspora shandongensis TaxID=418495 RepID=UPI0034454D9D
MSAVAELVGTFEPGSPEWHAARADGLGGSEIAAVLGLSPFESRFSLWHRKRGIAGPVEETEQMRAGRYFEDGIAQWFADEHPELQVRRTGTWRNRERPWQIANPDRSAKGPDGYEVVEIKNVYDATGWGEPGTDEVPVYYRAQVLWYLDVLGLSRARLAIAVGGCKFAEYVVNYSADEAAILRREAVEFLRTITDDERPSIDEHAETYQVIREMHPDIDNTRVEISPALAWQYRTASEVYDAAKAEKQAATSALADAMGTARRAFCDGVQLATRQARNGGIPFVVATKPKSAPTRIEAIA